MSDRSARPPKPSSQKGPHFRFERRLLKSGVRSVAGVDEVGRGPLAGPVTAAAVLLDPRDIPAGLDDSKALAAERRAGLYEEILGRAVAVGVGFASVAEIDRINIRQATFAAMRRALAALARPAAHVLIDGNDPPPDLPCPVTAIVKGDNLSVSIAAASIIAKVMRDRLMVRLDDEHPAYGFALHKGYATELHRSAILAHGLTAHHRRLFCAPKTSAGNGSAKKP